MNSGSANASATLAGRAYWRSLEERANSPAFRDWLAREFPDGAGELTDPLTRRHFLKIMSASFLLAGVGLTGCRQPIERIEPFAKQPANDLPGVPQYYATAMPVRQSAVPLLVKTSEGRPIKIEGNAAHPLNQLPGTTNPAYGGTDWHAQASILDLYDPDRAQRFVFRGQNTSQAKALDCLTQIAREAAADQGRGLAILMEQSSSPTRERLQQLLAARLPHARWFVDEPVDFDIHRQAASQVYGQSVKPQYHLERATKILALDCDFVADEEDAFVHIRRFAQGRRLRSPQDTMSRLYVVEGLYSLTGVSADHRLRLPPSAVFPLVCHLFAEFTAHANPAQLNHALPNALLDVLRRQSAGLKPEVKQWGSACLEDFLASPGETLVIAGHRQPLAVHLLAHVLNFYLGNVGTTINYHPVPAPSAENLGALAKTLDAGQVDNLVILGGNPAYTASPELAWPKVQRRARTVVRLGHYEDETAMLCDWHLPKAHYLESWGDARTGDGTVVAVQPLIEPLFGGLTEIEVLARLGALPTTSPYELTRATFKGFGLTGEFEENWRRFLYNGFLIGSVTPATAVQPKWNRIAPLLQTEKVTAAPTAEQLEVVFVRDHSVDDGRYNNNGWLQELPNPLTKITWDNVALLSPQTAHQLDLQIVDHEDNRLRVPVVRITLEGRSIEAPAWILPGLADGVVGVSLGYGRTVTGRIGQGTGYDAYRLRPALRPHFAGGATLTKTGSDYSLACTQDHWAMQGRPIIREANLAEYQQNPNFASALTQEEPPVVQSLYPNPLDKLQADALYQWGMSIDLNACVGCATCTLACQSENNIPIVGKAEVSHHREMHWLRLDRYFTGPLAEPQVVNQPMLCQHCEAAPCENVCPVNATLHDDEGLNVMVYNRCVGTRFCSNNCPYKVRRFNFFDYNRRTLAQLKGPYYPSPLISETDGEWTLKRWWKNRDVGTQPEEEWDLMKLVRNPDVTVRMRGVMEKCSMCLQRIEEAKIAQKIKAGASANIRVPDGTIRTACQQACPADAIVFGNLKDEQSRVTQAKAQTRTYRVLDFLNTKPRVTYLARVRNPNPAMPDYRPLPFSTVEFLRDGGNLQPEPAKAAGSGNAAGKKGTTG